MKHTGTIEIDCCGNTCGGCRFCLNYCDFFKELLDCKDYLVKGKNDKDFFRCPQCLETFKPVKE